MNSVQSPRNSESERNNHLAPPAGNRRKRQRRGEAHPATSANLYDPLDFDTMAAQVADPSRFPPANWEVPPPPSTVAAAEMQHPETVASASSSSSVCVISCQSSGSPQFVPYKKEPKRKKVHYFQKEDGQWQFSIENSQPFIGTFQLIGPFQTLLKAMQFYEHPSPQQLEDKQLKAKQRKTELKDNKRLSGVQVQPDLTGNITMHYRRSNKSKPTVIKFQDPEQAADRWEVLNTYKESVMKFCRANNLWGTTQLVKVIMAAREVRAGQRARQPESGSKRKRKRIERCHDIWKQLECKLEKGDKPALAVYLGVLEQRVYRWCKKFEEAENGSNDYQSRMRNLFDKSFPRNIREKKYAAVQTVSGGQKTMLVGIFDSEFEASIAADSIEEGGEGFVVKVYQQNLGTKANELNRRSRDKARRCLKPESFAT